MVFVYFVYFIPGANQVQTFPHHYVITGEYSKLSVYYCFTMVMVIYLETSDDNHGALCNVAAWYAPNHILVFNVLLVQFVQGQDSLMTKKHNTKNTTCIQKENSQHYLSYFSFKRWKSRIYWQQYLTASGAYSLVCSSRSYLLKQDCWKKNFHEICPLRKNIQAI